MNRGLIPLLKASSIISPYVSSLHCKNVFPKSKLLSILSLYKHKKITLVSISWIFGNIVVLVLYFGEDEYATTSKLSQISTSHVD